MINHVKYNKDTRVKYSYNDVKSFPKMKSSKIKGELVGVDFFIIGEFNNLLVTQMKELSDKMTLKMVSCKGLMIWPKQVTNCQSDMYRYRFCVSDLLSKNVTTIY